MRGELLVKIAVAEIASLGHEDDVVDELLLELDLRLPRKYSLTTLLCKRLNGHQGSPCNN